MLFLRAIVVVAGALTAWVILLILNAPGFILAPALTLAVAVSLPPALTMETLDWGEGDLDWRGDVAEAGILVALVLASGLIHEAGHIAVALALGYRIKTYTLLGRGGVPVGLATEVVDMEGIPLLHILLISIAGGFLQAVYLLLVGFGFRRAVSRFGVRVGVSSSLAYSLAEFAGIAGGFAPFWDVVCLLLIATLIEAGVFLLIEALYPHSSAWGAEKKTGRKRAGRVAGPTKKREKGYTLI